ncbi:vanadium-dependent haloperoxidase [Streptomyces sp. SBT349]|uniref:vanadium-dependent haloperoxidase n=1 Tax=Streptomyces sp. SBT349 TaxID=1580539 RepID=UPI000A51FF56|nr:vanadium-dependent haloperoxidase [Streptomyces sp. SBT349]
MTMSGRSYLPGFLPGRRSLLLGGIGGVSTAALTLGHSGSAAAARSAGSTAQQPPQIDFDFDTGNFVRDMPTFDIGEPDGDQVGGFIAPMDVTLQIRTNNMVHFGWYDALAPYHPTAVGVHTRIPRRPSSESATNRNMNIAGLHATYHVIAGILPERLPVYQEIFTLLGMDYEDESEDLTSPVGIGNVAGKGVVAARLHDGMNQLGDEGPRYNGRPYEDYTGYEPVNTAFKLRNPSRWQPQLTTHNRRLGPPIGDKGVFTVQHFATPQFALVKPYTFDDPGQFELAAPQHSDHTRPRDYKRSVDEILDASANLTDAQKVMAEFFDNKLLGIGFSVHAAAHAHELDLQGWAQLFLTHSIALHDGLVVAWHNKNRYDAVRPFSAVRHVYGNSKVTAWGGVGKGTVDDIPASEWASYLAVGDHSEYPSGSTTLCSAEAQATRRFFDDDVLQWTHPVPAGSTLVEPGISPAADLELRWDSWTAFVEDCATSRVWGGVHFKTTVERSVELGEQFGDLAYEFLQRYINGDVED